MIGSKGAAPNQLMKDVNNEKRKKDDQSDTLVLEKDSQLDTLVFPYIKTGESFPN